MNEEATRRDSFNWWFPLYGAAGALVLFVPVIIDLNNILGMLYFLVATPLVGLVLLVVAIRKKGRRRLAVFSMFVAYLATSWGLFTNSFGVRTTVRWLLWSKDYKAEVAKQPNSADGALKHIEWDGWGFPGAGDTVAYLVFDPNDSLSTAAASHSSGKFSGIPCEVLSVRRLESHYYSVLFYTDTDWGR